MCTKVLRSMRFWRPRSNIMKSKKITSWFATNWMAAHNIFTNKAIESKNRKAGIEPMSVEATESAVLLTKQEGEYFRIGSGVSENCFCNSRWEQFDVEVTSAWQADGHDGLIMCSSFACTQICKNITINRSKVWSYLLGHNRSGRPIWLGHYLGSGGDGEDQADGTYWLETLAGILHSSDDVSGDLVACVRRKDVGVRPRVEEWVERSRLNETTASTIGSVSGQLCAHNTCCKKAWSWRCRCVLFDGTYAHANTVLIGKCALKDLKIWLMEYFRSESFTSSAQLSDVRQFTLRINSKQLT